LFRSLFVGFNSKQTARKEESEVNQNERGKQTIAVAVERRILGVDLNECFGRCFGCLMKEGQ